MSDIEKQLAELSRMIRKHCPHNGPCSTVLDELRLYREAGSRGKESVLYEPALIIAAQGQKNINLDGKRFHYCAGRFLALFTPMAVECEIIGATPEQPMLVAAIMLDRHRLANLLMKMDSVNPHASQLKDIDTSGIFSAAVKAPLLDAVMRLLRTLDDPTEAAVLSEAIIDEIYFRILSEEQGGALRFLLRQQGLIQQISRAVEHLHDNLDKNITVEHLASLVNMSQSGFHKKFREVMHVSPIQYAKLIRLNRARSYLMEGKNVSEAGYMVGYNSLAQFSREYKRQFGESPSAT